MEVWTQQMADRLRSGRSRRELGRIDVRQWMTRYTRSLASLHCRGQKLATSSSSRVTRRHQDQVPIGANHLVQPLHGTLCRI